MKKQINAYCTSKIFKSIKSVVILLLVVLSVAKPIDSIIEILSGEKMELSYIDSNQKENESEDSQEEENSENDLEEKEKIKDDCDIIVEHQIRYLESQNSIQFEETLSNSFIPGVTVPPPEQP